MLPNRKWLHKQKKCYKLIGDQEVDTLGKWKTPAGLNFDNSRKIIHVSLQSHELDGDHPLVLSNIDQAKLKFVKDMETGTCYFNRAGNMYIKLAEQVE